MKDEGNRADEIAVGTRTWPAAVPAVELEARMRLGRDQAYPVPLELEELLRAVRDHGSIVKGFEHLRISYQSALLLIRRWEAITGHTLVVQQRGQGTELTPFGLRLVNAREWIDARLRRDFDRVAQELALFLAVDSEPARQRIVMHASHDLAVERMQAFARPRIEIDLRTSGSLAALTALKRGQCDIAGFHLPEPASTLGPELAAFAGLLNPREHSVVRLFGRQQGLLLRNDMRRRITGVRDVVRLGLRIVNRERGSGTRLLFDALLAREKIDPARVPGYEREVPSHTASARAIRGGEADVAFGIEAAARAQGLRFVPVIAESYYLACRRSDETSVALDTLAACVRSDAFAAAITRIGGYDLAESGFPVRVAELFAAPLRREGGAARRPR